MRLLAPGLKLGTTFLGFQGNRKYRSPDFPVGSFVTAKYGWRSHTVSSKDDKNNYFGMVSDRLPPLNGLSPSLALGVLDEPGNSAYFGFLEITNPKEGDETVVVSGAAGAVGNHVGQIAKIKGCKVVGIAGSDEKGKWLTEDLGFDHVINYKTQNVEEELKRVAPQGIDIYFDNVGGEISSTVLSLMNNFVRISVCGCISAYNENEFIPKVTMIQRYMINKQLKMEAFHVHRWLDRFSEATKQNLQWILEGKLKCRETVTEGFENMPKAFVEMLQGKNFGKAVVKV